MNRQLVLKNNFKRSIEKAQGRPFDRELYTYQKLIGARRKSGALNIQTLKPKHKQLLALHLQGVSNNVIAEVLDMAATHVSVLLGDPLMRRYIGEFHEGADAELQSLFPMAIDSFRRGLEDDDVKTSMIAGKEVFKALGKFQRHDTKQAEGETAEDVIARALSLARDGMNMARDALPQRAKLIEGISKESNDDS